MKYEVSIYELGELLKKIDSKYKMNILVKRDLSGGWMTITGEATIENLPSIGSNCGKASNILGIRVITENEGGASVKLTGAKNKKFAIETAPTKFKEISLNSLTLNQIKINNEECKLRVDDDIIFTIKASVEEVEKLILL